MCVCTPRDKRVFQRVESVYTEERERVEGKRKTESGCTASSVRLESTEYVLQYRIWAGR